MTAMILIYFAISLTMLLALARMILTIGRALGQCEGSKRAADAGGITIATGFVAIGVGGVILVGALLPALVYTPGGLLGTLGLSCLMLGLGFTHAVSTLRAVVMDAQFANKAMAVPVAKRESVPMEPVLA